MDFHTFTNPSTRPPILSFSREDVDKLFSSHDKDGDGKLSWREFAGEETKNERAFKLMDENHDGKITKSVNE